MFRKLRYLMNAVDSSPGGGSPPPGGSPASSQPTGNTAPASGGGQPSGGAPAAPPFDVNALAQALVPAVAKGVHDTVFARLREAGVLGRKDGNAAPGAGAGSETPAAGAPAAPPAAVDIEAVIERRENFALELGRFDVPTAAIARARQAFKAENPTDIATWARSYASDMGWKERAASSAAAGTSNPGTGSPQPPPSHPPPSSQQNPPPGGKPIAASPTAPGTVDAIDSGEIIDVSKLTDEQILKLGPDGIRREVERAVDSGRARSGRPPIPAVLRQKR